MTGLEGNGWNVLKHMIINKVIDIDMNKFICRNEPLIINGYQTDLDDYLKSRWEWYKKLLGEKY